MFFYPIYCQEPPLLPSDFGAMHQLPLSYLIVPVDRITTSVLDKFKRAFYEVIRNISVDVTTDNYPSAFVEYLNSRLPLVVTLQSANGRLSGQMQSDQSNPEQFIDTEWWSR